MATLTVPNPNWNDGQSNLNVDHRASVLSAQYAPSVFTFNANWAPAPLSAPVPLQLFGSSAVASSSRASRWSSDGSYLRGRTAGPSSAPAETFDDDGERVSHLDFDSDGDGGEGKAGERRYGRYDWHEEQPGRHGNNYDDDYSPDPTPTQEQPNCRTFGSQRRPISPVTGSNAVLRAYLESYGFPDGLGYERPPLDLSYRSSSPSSHYSFHSDANSGEDSDDNNANSKIAYDYPRRSRPNANSPAYPNLHSELPPLAPSAWPASLKATNALLTSLALDSLLLDDPHGAWEALCWDEAAPESDSESETGPDYEHDGQPGQGQVSKLRTGLGGNVDGVVSWLRSTEQEDVSLEYRAHEKLRLREESWREESPSPVFRRRDDITESDVVTEAYRDDDEADVRTVSNATWNDAGDASGASTITSTGTSTITAGDSEEWISLTGARAQAARARILPYRYVQAPFPTYPQTDTDVSVLAASIDAGRTARTPVDPVLAGTPAPPVMTQREAEDAGVTGDAQTVATELGDMLANTEGEGAAEDEIAPDYGECSRDQLVTLSERDPPPYDLEYESTYASRSQSRMQDRPGDTEETRIDSQSQAASASFSQNNSLAQPKIFTHTSATRTRSQLTFPTSPTESDTIQSTISPTSTSSSNATPPFSRSPITPTTETSALMTPAGTYLSTSSNAHPFRKFSSYSHTAQSPSKFGSGFAEGVNTMEDSPEYPFLSPPGRVSLSTRATRGPRPLPPRPAGLGPRAMAEAWLSASAAGPYAAGSSARAVSASASTPGPIPGAGSAKFASWNASGSRTGLSEGFVTGTNPTTWAASDFGIDASGRVERANDSDEEVDAVQSHESGAVQDITNSERSITRYPFALPASEKSYSTESLVRLNMIEEKENEREKGSDESLGEFRSSSETAFQIIASKIRVESDGIGMQPSPSLQRGKRSRSGSGNSGAGKSLHRLATRCSTLTRRIGLVATGRER